MSPFDLSARALAASIQRGETTPQSVIAEAIERAEERNPAINAICALNPEAKAEAASVTKRLEAGETLPLAGVPVLIKDNIWVKDLPITNGSRLYADHIAPEDAKAVARLREAGAVILGITTCSEFACKGATSTPLYGITRNPIDPALTSGGSSGGSVAGVAAGIAPLSNRRRISFPMDRALMSRFGASLSFAQSRAIWGILHWPWRFLQGLPRKFRMLPRWRLRLILERDSFLIRKLLRILRMFAHVCAKVA